MRGQKVPAPSAEAIVLATVQRFASDQPALERFLDASGLDLRAMRAGVADGSLEGGLLHYLAGDEDLLLSVATDLMVPPHILAAVIARRDLVDPDAPVSAGSSRRASASVRRVPRKG